MVSQAEKAEAFRALHHETHPLVLPNAWDVPSARVFEDAGFPAVATSSAGLMVSLGYPDGEEIPRREVVAVVNRIASRLAIPLSADVVSGFGRTPRAVAATVRKMVEAGAVGINLEDLEPSTGGLLRPSLQVQKIRAIRELGTSLGFPIFVNARTDAFRHAPGDENERLHQAIRRSTAYRDAGADCVYPMGLTDARSIDTFVRALGCPVNVMVRKGLPPITELEALGVKRVSFGPSASYAALGLLKRASQEILARGTYGLLTEGAITFDELNQLARPRPAKAAPPG
jgi:2-methylisocitrate lyase-like PEP mutase family enzyme